jgi:hypothetical protein
MTPLAWRRMLLALALPSAVALAGCSSEEPVPPLPEPDPQTSMAAGDTMLATAFPLTSVLQAAEAALPDDVTIRPVPGDTRWLPGNQIEVPVERDGSVAVVVVTVLPERAECGAQSPLLDPAEADALAAQVCATWEAEGRLPVVVPDPDAAAVLDPSDAAR